MRSPRNRELSRPNRRYVPPDGYSATIRGALKILVGVVIKIGGWALSAALQDDIVQGISLLVGIAFDLWGASQVYQARMDRGDVDWTGKRVKPVEIIVAPEPPPPVIPMTPKEGD